MDLTIQQAKPVDTPIKSVTLVLTDREAQVLKHVGNYSQRVAREINRVMGGDTTDNRSIPTSEIDSVLCSLWRHLGGAGVKVK